MKLDQDRGVGKLRGQEEFVRGGQIMDKNTISDLTTKVENLEVENCNLKKNAKKLRRKNEEDNFQAKN